MVVKEINNKGKVKKNMFCEWKGNTTSLYFDNRVLLRKFNTRQPVQCAVVSGEGNDARVSITMVNGKTELYQGNGVLLRK